MYEMKIYRNSAHALSLTANKSNNKTNSQVNPLHTSFIFHRNNWRTQTHRSWHKREPIQWNQAVACKRYSRVATMWPIVYSRVPCEQSSSEIVSENERALVV